jgi:hypothetical protein
MKQKERHHLRLKHALTAAYRSKEEAEISDSWQTKTMSRIRSIRPLDTKSDYLMNLEQMVWRLAPAACVLIIAFSVCLFNIDFAQEYDLAKLFLDDPVEYVFVQSFGI